MDFSQRKKAFQRKILQWYAKHQRSHLPWRKTTNPYHILVSEIMLQQTQVGRVIPYYLAFIQKFPTIRHLAKAKGRALLTAWSGLGYNRRALHLKRIAQILVTTYKGKVPDNAEDLQKLPGIGIYTSHAILAFAFNREAPAIDTNIRRVLLSEFTLNQGIPHQELEAFARSLIPQGKSRVWNSALMDYGALIATAKKTGISSVSRQPLFQGSTRQIRGNIIHCLISTPSLPLSALQKKFPHRDINPLIAKMEKEGLLIIKKGCVKLA